MSIIFIISRDAKLIHLEIYTIIVKWIHQVKKDKMMFNKLLYLIVSFLLNKESLYIGEMENATRHGWGKLIWIDGIINKKLLLGSIYDG